MLLSPRRPDTSAFPRRPTPKRGTGEAIAIDRRRYRRRKCLWRHASPRGHASWVSACHRADLAQPILHNCARELHALALPSMSRLASKSAYKPLKQPKNKIFHNIPYANRRTPHGYGRIVVRRLSAGGPLACRAAQAVAHALKDASKLPLFDAPARHPERPRRGEGIDRPSLSPGEFKLCRMIQPRKPAIDNLCGKAQLHGTTRRG